MNLLAFDTSTDMLSIAVQAGDQIWQVQQAGGAQSSKALLPQVLELLRQAGLALAQLDAIVYGCGPGAFTGLRTSCAAAQGLAWGSGVPTLPVDSLLAIAEQARCEHGAERVMAVLDARMQEVYAAPYRWHAAGLEQGGAGHWQREADILVLPPQELQLPTGYVLAGNAQTAYPEAFAHHALPHHQARPTAQAMLRLAPALMARNGLQTAMEVAPLYIRNKVAQTTQERLLTRQRKPS
ncbi:tRNA (adenosine(37)-N6)-threonylcarbamoyltransferase complex dimerization subunit type 1 TsaB [Vandammella animalimorsus]|uniref:tRNA (adenosine(37)-N6)-threonylcarbamoyltransferase complex dimerization subunit type 1 TsaB n=1 Tax=Vandammella animalimorsus TaxID=2029117 RepID=UPI00325C07CA